MADCSRHVRQRIPGGSKDDETDGNGVGGLPDGTKWLEGDGWGVEVVGGSWELEEISLERRWVRKGEW